ncbi:MAG: YcaO-like family protein [Patescibacteria group bacterium]
MENKQREHPVIHPRILNLLERLRTRGIIHAWYKMPLNPGLPPIISYNMGVNTIVMPSGRQFSFQGGAGSGVGATSDEALTRAIAEALERYSLSVWQPQDITLASFEELRFFGAVDPKMFAFFSEKQLMQDRFVKNRISRHDRIGWVRARSLARKKNCFVPAQLVYLSYNTEFEEEVSFLHTTTNGAAAAATLEEAACRAICEAIERDAFLIFWLNKISPPHIDQSSVRIPAARKIIDDIVRYGLELRLLDMTTDMGIPTIAAVVVDYRGEIAVSVSVATDFSPEQCLLKVLGEATKLMHSPVDKKILQAAENKYPQIESMEERRALWSSPHMTPHLGFLFESKKRKTLDSMRDTIPVSVLAPTFAHGRLKFLRDTLNRKKYDCYLVDVTSTPAREEGLYVVRAIVPQLMPIYFVEGKKYLGVERLYAAPVAMGYREVPLKEEELNPIPHPFI